MEENTGPKEIERYYGSIIRVMGKTVYGVPLPDWSLNYVRINGDMAELRAALTRARVMIVKVTDQRIYFVER